MTKKCYKKDVWLDSLDKLSKKQKVFVPAKEGNGYVFKVMADGIEPCLEAQKTTLSPKQVAFPQSERMFNYTLDKIDPEVGVLKDAPKDFSPQAVVGVRPCDAASFLLVQKNFDTPHYTDPWWTKYYAATTFVGLGCTKIAATCFCTSVGSDPHDEKGLDALMYDLGETYLVNALSEKGEAFLSQMDGGKDATDDEQKAAEALTITSTSKVESKVEIDKIPSISEKDLFDAPFWTEMFEGCINCGACTYSCPTCWCFDIQDEIKKTNGDRIRNWDSCMFPQFTKHGLGHNPRGQKYQRVRQRFMHKLKYYTEKYGNDVLCVGCGRCIDNCPVNIDIREAASLMNNYIKQG